MIFDKQKKTIPSPKIIPTDLRIFRKLNFSGKSNIKIYLSDADHPIRA
jgi:hypothetical protein